MSLLLSIAAAAPSRAAIGTTPVAYGLEFPDFVTAPPGDPRLFILERRGDIRILRDGNLMLTPFVDIDSLVEDLSLSPETGLIGLAFHPSFPDTPYVYMYYIDNANESVIARYTISANDPDVVDYSSAQIYLRYPHPYYAHYGGHLVFGADGYLYVGMGDGGHQSDPDGYAQNLNVLWGKILRLDVNHPPPYTIPPDNPFVGVPNTQPEIWAYGLRNPYRYSFDPANGDIWIGDVGQDKFEEVDHIRAPVPGGINYGWALMEGDSCHVPPTNCGSDTLTHPVWWYDHTQGCAVMGGYVYRGNYVSDLKGEYLFADFCYGRVWEMSPDSTVTELTAQLEPATGPFGMITGFGEDGFGEMYIVGYGTGANGTIYKIVDPSLVGVPHALPHPALAFLGPAPNPARGTARFSLETATGGLLDLTVLDVTGRQVARLASGRRAPGTYAFVWDGRTSAGRRAAAGSYLVRASLDGRVMTRSVVYLP